MASTPQTPVEPAAPTKKTNADILSLFNSAPAPQVNNQFGGFQQQNNMFGGFGGAQAMQQAPPPQQQSTGSNLDILGTN